MCKTKRLGKAAFKEVDFSKQQYNLVAIVERGGNVVSISTNNMTKSHGSYFNGEHDKGIHAEYAALRDAKYTEGANLHVFRFRRDGSYGNSRPCTDCMRKLIDSGIKKVYYHYHGKSIQEKVC